VNKLYFEITEHLFTLFLHLFALVNLQIHGGLT